MKLCPYCAEEIQEKAVKCKHCGEWLNKNSSEQNEKPTKQAAPSRPRPKAPAKDDKVADSMQNKEHLNNLGGVLQPTIEWMGECHKGCSVMSFYEAAAAMAEFVGDDDEDMDVDDIGNYINALDVSQVRLKMEEYIDDTSTLLAGWPNDLLSDVCEECGVSLEKYAITEEQIAASQASLSNALKRNMSQFHIALGEVTKLHSRLVNDFPKFQKLVGDSGFDIAHLAKCAGGGALSATVPWIGIPMLIHAFKSDHDKGKSQSQFMDNFVKMYETFCDSIGQMYELCEKIEEKQEPAIMQHLKSSLGKHLLTSFSKIARDGVPLGPAIDYLVGMPAALEKAANE